MKRRVILSMCLILWGIYTCVSANAAEYRNELPAGKYAVVVSKKTYADAEWKKVVEALMKKHQAEVVEYDDKVDGALDSLKKSMPRYVCFVAKPEEAKREFVVAVSRLTRKLNDDP
jgi:hypothetical protein